MKIEELKRFDKFATENGTFDIVVLEVLVDRISVSDGEERISSHRIYYIKIPTNPEMQKGRYDKGYPILCRILESGSELRGWNYVKNVADEFECRCYTFFNSEDHQIIKSVSGGFNSGKWKRFFQFETRGYSYCSLEPSSNVTEKFISDLILEWVEFFGEGGCYGTEFGFYKVNGKIRKVVRNRNTVYYLDDKGDVKWFHVKSNESYLNKMIRTFDFSKEHFRLTLYAYSDNIKA
jgi:hypothetical protein